VSHSRRDFLKTASIAALAAAGTGSFPRALSALDVHPRAGDPILQDLAARALEAARGAGATYADVRLTLTRAEIIRTFGSSGYFFQQNEELAGIGVRALVDGAWGFTASALWTPDEAARLGREAAVQARTNAPGRRRRIEIGDTPAVVKGQWVTPIKRDPFDVTLEEKLEVAWAFAESASRINISSRNASVGAGMVLGSQRQEKTFASTDGSLVMQTLYSAQPSFSVGVATPNGRAGRSSDLLQPTAGGWEVVSEAKLVDEMPRLIEESLLMVEAEKIDPNRYDIVFDARATAQIVARTVGVASELDRVLGFEANAGGTSYLAPPADRLGSFAVGSSLLNVAANRSRPGGLATVKWDDEGVVPEDYSFVKDGVLVDYHTTREIAGELASWYSKNGTPVRSHGGASAESANHVTLLHTPNIEMKPGRSETSFDELVAGLDKGLVICAGMATVDRQQLNGEVNGEMVYEVRKGKRTRFIHSAEVLFRAPELWKSLRAIGGASSQIWTGATVRKGQPSQEYSFGVGAVPAAFKMVAVTDKKRKA
jgi:TldD protein